MARGWSKGFEKGNAVFQMHALSNAANEAGHQIFIDACGLEIRMIRVLRLIDDQPGITFAGIVKAAGLERSHVSRMIQQLIREGFVERRNSEHDARQFELYALDRGREARRKADSLSERGLDVLFAPLDEGQKRAFVETLNTLARWVDSEGFEEAMKRELSMAAEGADTPSP